MIRTTLPDHLAQITSKLHDLRKHNIIGTLVKLNDRRTQLMLNISILTGYKKIVLSKITPLVTIYTIVHASLT